MDVLMNFSPLLQAFIATLFTWAVTALGASTVFFIKTPRREVFVSLLGFAGGVMLAASYFSLLLPAVELSREINLFPWIPSVTGFLSGSLFLWGMDRLLPHLHRGSSIEEREGVKLPLSPLTLLIFAITLHNIPEGLAVGVAFGSLSQGFSREIFVGAVALTLGIGLQNFPEGMAVSLPLRGEGFSRKKSFWFGQLSGIVEPVAGIVGAWAVSFFRLILPYALSFAAGAMIYVVIEEVIPETQKGGNTDLSALSFLSGFSVMMFLDIVLS